MTGIAHALHDPKDGDIFSVNFHYVKADLRAAYQLYHRPTRTIWALLLILALAITAATFMLSRQVSQAILTVAILLGGAAVGGFAVSYVYLPWFARHNFTKSPLSHLEYKLTLRSEGITIQNPRGTSTLHWNDFSRWRTSGKATLIFVSPTTYFHFPARLAELGFPVDRLKTELMRELGPPF